jgi:hypothetical protein
MISMRTPRGSVSVAPYSAQSQAPSRLLGVDEDCRFQGPVSVREHIQARTFVAVFFQATQQATWQDMHRVELVCVFLVPSWFKALLHSSVG